MRARCGRRRARGGGFRIPGSKQWITNAGFGGTMLLFARTEPATRSSRGMSAFVVDGAEVEITRVEEKLGLDSSVTNDLALDAWSAPTGWSVRCTAASGSRWRRSTAAGSASPRRRWGSRRRGTTSRAAMRRAPGVRTTDRRLPGDPARAREHVDGDRRGTAARASRAWLKDGGGRWPRPARRRSSSRRRWRGGRRPRRSRCSAGTATRRSFRSSGLPRREGHEDVRGDERDPAARDRARAPRREQNAATTSTSRCG